MDAALELSETLLKQLNVIASTDTIIGDPFQAGDISIIPVSRVSMGVGIGGGGQRKQGEAILGGGGVKVEPIAFLVIKDGNVSLLNIGRGKGLDAIYEKVPEVIDKIVGEVSRRVKNKKESSGNEADISPEKDAPSSESE